SGEGIIEVPDPSSLFRSHTTKAVSGTCTTIALEGKRALPVEIQALVVPSTAAQPRRVVNGVESSRVAMILAVLERRAGLPVSQADVYVSTVGGIKVYEPATDLAIALAIASAAKDIPLSQEMAAIGEISLAGEIRAVTQAPQRASEAARLGFSSVLDHSTASIHEAITRAFSGSPKKQKQPAF
ncbi:MAG TPA: magnesium chelatase domain-containing protein, partial [Pontimonas sp.]|nr:magnesium chelatase domain-containing protein [Pontimonas sp.]